MMDIGDVVEKCAEVVTKWQQREPTLELAQDFASVFGFQLNWTLTPTAAPTEDPAEPAPIVAAPPQYELFTELSEQDKYAIKSWRSNNGL